MPFESSLHAPLPSHRCIARGATSPTLLGCAVGLSGGGAVVETVVDAAQVIRRLAEVAESHGGGAGSIDRRPLDSPRDCLEHFKYLRWIPLDRETVDEDDAIKIRLEILQLSHCVR